MANRYQKAQAFVKKWKDRGDEKQDTQQFWNELLSQIYDVNILDPGNVKFEKKIIKSSKNPGFKDVVINDGFPDDPENNDGYVCNRVLVEQKSFTEKLDVKEMRSGKFVTPFEQAKAYDDASPKNEKADYIITCNFQEFWIYDMNGNYKDWDHPEKLKLEDLPSHFDDYLCMLGNHESSAKKPIFTHEVDISKEAGDLVGKLYDELRERYHNPDDSFTLQSLNVLCVRLVFCLYAEDAGLFNPNNRHTFHDYLVEKDPIRIRKALKDLFKLLDQPVNERDEYLEDEDPLLASFPYVNGGLFHDAGKEYEIPMFSEATKELLVKQMSEGFDWSKISPTIFGAVFESTLNQETRRSGGMHYTSIENIHKVIDPLFLNDLIKEFSLISQGSNDGGKRTKALHKFQDKLASLKFFDPAAGSGNFLTETYLSLRKLENDILKMLARDQNIGMNLDVDFKDAETERKNKLEIKVSIQQMFGIEINDFAVSVAKTALWISEAQMFEKTEEILHDSKEFFPLQSYNNMKEGNALKIDWNEVLPSDECSFIMGNPPFIGMKEQSNVQKSELQSATKIKVMKQLDYVAGWYFIAANYISPNTKCAFVSSNSITQGEQALTMWKPLFNELGIHINFAYRTFQWDSEASIKAHVHCVIIGFSKKDDKDKTIFDGSSIIKTNKISQYLSPSDSVFIEKVGKPICNVEPMTKGAQLIDGGNFIIGNQEEYEKVTKKYPEVKNFAKKYYNAKSFLNRENDTYVLYLENCSPKQINDCPYLRKKVEEVYKFRSENEKNSTKVLEDTPSKYFQSQIPSGESIIVPVVSSSRRKYIPMGFMPKNMVYTNALFFVDKATLYDFGILESIIHMYWTKAFCGRMKSDYRYSNTIVYNTFPWPKTSESEKKLIEKTAQAILDARELYPDCSLSDLYDPLTMPEELKKAHRENDNAVMDAYGLDKDLSESEIIAELLKMYQGITEQKKK